MIGEILMNFDTLINAQELADNINNPNWVIFDCRLDSNETNIVRKKYLEGHIPGAIYVHLDDDLSGPIIANKTSRHPLPVIDVFVKKLSNWGINDQTQVIVYDDLGGSIADRLWWMLQWLGHENIAVLNGGFQQWEKSKNPIDNIIPVQEPKTFVPVIQNNRLVNIEAVVTLQNSPDHLLVDCRAPERYRGEKEPLDHTAGHIPGAVNLFFQDNLNENSLFHSKEYLKKRFLNVHGEKPVENIIYYCGSGVTATHNLLALKYAGLGNASLYAGSWSEWITDPTRPIGTN